MIIKVHNKQLSLHVTQAEAKLFSQLKVMKLRGEEHKENYEIELTLAKPNALYTIATAMEIPDDAPKNQEFTITPHPDMKYEIC